MGRVEHVAIVVDGLASLTAARWDKPPAVRARVTNRTPRSKD